MKSDGPLKHILLAFVLALGCYIVLYQVIEHRRVKKGPWEVTFTNGPAGAPAIIINQPKLAIENVEVSFLDRPPASSNELRSIVFKQPQQVPFDVPFGKCVFEDLTFLPGTVVLEVYGHEIELLPRVLTVDRQEHPWLSNSTITLHPRETPLPGPPSRQR